MTAPIMEALPYGIRDCKITAYADAVGSILGDTSLDLANMQTFSFSETEEFQELRGDDRIVTTRGQGAQVEWELEAGGISLRMWAIFTGGEIIESGLTPNRKITLRKFATAARKYFKVEGQAISDSGGDIHTIVYRCRCNDTIEGEFADGEFFITSISGLGLPLLDEGFDLLYDLVQNETAVTIPTTPIANPFGSVEAPTVTDIASTTVTVHWNDITGPTSYDVEKSVSPYSTWTAAAGGDNIVPGTEEADITGLTASTAYKFRVVGNPDGKPSDPSAVVTTTA